MTASHVVGVVAHQGGWDEILLIAGPMVLIAGLLVLAKRRVDAAQHGDRGSEGADTTSSTAGSAD